MEHGLSAKALASNNLHQGSCQVLSYTLCDALVVKLWLLVCLRAFTPFVLLFVCRRPALRHCRWKEKQRRRCGQTSLQSLSGGSDMAITCSQVLLLCHALNCCCREIHNRSWHVFRSCCQVMHTIAATESLIASTVGLFQPLHVLLLQVVDPTFVWLLPASHVVSTAGQIFG